MANNPYVNKVTIGNQTVLDLTGDTVDAAHLAEGYTAHCADGSLITGEMNGVSINGDTVYCTYDRSATGLEVGNFVSVNPNFRQVINFKRSEFNGWENGLPLCMKSYSNNIALIFYGKIIKSNSTTKATQGAVQAVVIENNEIKQYGPVYTFGNYMRASFWAIDGVYFNLAVNQYIQNKVDILDFYEDYIVVKLDSGIYLLTLDVDSLSFSSVANNVLSPSSSIIDTVKVKNGLYLRVISTPATTTYGSSTQKSQLLKINNNGTITQGVEYYYTAGTYTPKRIFSCVRCYTGENYVITLAVDPHPFYSEYSLYSYGCIKMQFDENELSLNFNKIVNRKAESVIPQGEQAGIYIKSGSTTQKYDFELNLVETSPSDESDWDIMFFNNREYYLSGYLWSVAAYSNRSTIHGKYSMRTFLKSIFVPFDNENVIFKVNPADSYVISEMYTDLRVVGTIEAYNGTVYGVVIKEQQTSKYIYTVKIPYQTGGEN